jgi:hypothetical protein
MNERKIFTVIFIGLVILLLLTGGVSMYALQTTDKGSIIVYGSKTCPWCVKQEDYLKQKGIPYDFVDCKQGQCPEFVKGFPTIMKDGEILSGYTEL